LSRPASPWPTQLGSTDSSRPLPSSVTGSYRKLKKVRISPFRHRPSGLAAGQPADSSARIADRPLRVRL